MDAAFSFKPVKCMVGDYLLRKELSITINNQTKPLKSLPASCSQAEGSNSKIVMQSTRESVISTLNKFAKGKLSLGAKILQVGGVERAFRRIFNVRDDEKLLKASQCSLYTTAGPLTGRLFISAEKLAFCSDKPIAKYASPSGEVFSYHYKVVIPLRKVNKTNQIENAKKPSKKYLQVVTNDGFEFWFVGLPNYKRTVTCLNQALS